MEKVSELRRKGKELGFASLHFNLVCANNCIHPGSDAIAAATEAMRREKEATEAAAKKPASCKKKTTGSKKRQGKKPFVMTEVQLRANLCANEKLRIR